jgi:ribose 5-phosphate isomerase A
MAPRLGRGAGVSPDPAVAGKRAAGRAAVWEVRPGMVLGLGTGSTVRHFLEGLAEAIDEGTLHGLRGVATSEDTAARATELGIPLADLAEAGSLDLAVDGADEVDPGLDLIKGLGGALLREKMVVQAARRFVVIADSAKEVRGLGTRAPLPVEVVPFGWEVHLPFFRSLGADPKPRRTDEGGLLLTDNGNPVIDLHFPGGIDDPRGLDERLHRRAGVVETGLFLGLAHRAYLGGSGGVSTRDR